LKQSLGSSRLGNHAQAFKVLSRFSSEGMSTGFAIRAAVSLSNPGTPEEGMWQKSDAFGKASPTLFW
jgi:hypothetical protein